MATDVIMPALGVAQEKGTLINWLKAEGDSVTKGEPLMEVETDKATVEIEAPASGILTSVTASPGDEIPVGNRIAVILAPGELASPAPVRSRHPASSPHPSSLPKGEGMREERQGADEGHPLPVGGEGRLAVRGRILASPAAKRIARERGFDLSAVRGTGPDGAVLSRDVIQFTAEKLDRAGESRVKETVRLTPMRRIIGERMSKSKQTAPHFYLSMDVDMTAVSQQRTSFKEEGERLVPSINDYIVSAAARALREFPLLNATFTEEGIQMHSEVNLGVAVALEEGLVVPVIRNADRLSLAEIAKQSRELTEKAQTKKLLPLDYEGGTFTVSNLGMFGVDNFVAIINPPQSAILAVGRVAPRLVPKNEGFTVRPMMTMSLSADHRVVDGAIAARFLQAVKQHLERES
jgi:pyruvate dehydrogenase E2 component (dihydrolipoamide acetyltransferase)